MFRKQSTVDFQFGTSSYIFSILSVFYSVELFQCSFIFNVTFKVLQLQVSQLNISNTSMESELNKNKQKSHQLFYDRWLKILWNCIPDIFYGTNSNYQTYETKMGYHKQNSSEILEYELINTPQTQQRSLQEYINKYYPCFRNLSHGQMYAAHKQICAYEIILNKSENNKKTNKNYNVDRNMFKTSAKNLMNFTNNDWRYIDNNLSNLIEIRRSLQITQVFNCISLAACQILHLNNNNNKQIPSHINHIIFPYLTELNLSNNKIQSIHDLIYLQAPNLTQLHLDNNRITNISCFVRISLNMPYLKKLYLFNNFIGDGKDANNCDFFVKCNFSKISCLKLELFGTSSVNFNGSLTWLIKNNILSSNYEIENRNQRLKFLNISEDNEKMLKLMGIQFESNSFVQFKKIYIESKKRIPLHTKIIKQMLGEKMKKMNLKANTILPKIVNLENPFQI